MKIGSALFKKELALIKNEHVREIVATILNNDVHFDNFLRPSSSTGRHHPDFDNCYYGNTNHTKAVVKLCNVFLTSRIDIEDFYSDIIYASAILHDMWKYAGTSHTRDNLAEIAYEFLKNYEIPDASINNYFIGISLCIRLHMGHWSMNDWLIELNKIKDMQLRDSVLILHYADMIASRKFYNIKDFSL